MPKFYGVFSYHMKVFEKLRIVDLTLNIAGPYSTQILADLGADVIKVEPPGGDPSREWGPPFWGDETPLFLSSNRNKRSIIVDLKSDDGQGVVKRLVGESDVFVQAFRKGVIESLGFGYECLRELYPGLVYASITGFGSKGPLAEMPGYDPLIQAYSGMMSITGDPDSPPARCGAAVVDLGTGILTALGILAALRERDNTGRGVHVETSLLDTSMAWLGYHLYSFLASGDIPQRWGAGSGMVTPYESFPTKDGELMISGGNNAIFVRLCNALGLEEVAGDNRFCDNPSRVENRRALREILMGRTRDFSTDQLRTLLEEHRVPCSPIQTLEEVADDPQVRASRMLEAYPHPRISNYRALGFPVRFDGDRPGTRIVPPLPGEHSIEVLGELGYSSAEINRFRQNGSVVTADPVQRH